MTAHKLEFRVFCRADHGVPIIDKHESFIRKMADVDGPLSFQGASLPPTPDCGPELVASWSIKSPKIKGVNFIAHYTFRGSTYEYEDRAAFDDRLWFGIKMPKKGVDYGDLVKHQFPKLIEAFDAYRAFVSFDLYDFEYQGGLNHTNSDYNQLAADPKLDVDGRNNIFTLQTAQYWDDELCHRALGYGPDEVVRRLQGKVPLVKRLMNGVYTVLNDNPDLTYQEFADMNDTFKPILGLAESKRS